nr:MAG TPA_asm: hypothetical protein [Caudoviricetes sp.]
MAKKTLPSGQMKIIIVIQHVTAIITLVSSGPELHSGSSRISLWLAF